jgi:c(7)-type cytochrome triheme protein
MKPSITSSILAVSLLMIAFLSASAERIEQPIKYNHKKHVKELEMDCTECHRYAKTMARATIPNIEVCQDCHAEPMTDSGEEKKLVSYITKGEKIPWVKVYRVPSNVYFSHRRHTVLAGIDCTVCHGDIGKLDKPVTRQLVRISMKNCLKCHEKEKAETDCTRCHR